MRERTARLFDCQTRHQSGVLPCEGERVVIIPPKGLAPPGVGWRCVKAWHGTREASKCWGNEVADTLLKEGCKAVVVVPMMFASENHGNVTVCHGDDFVYRGSAAALDEVDRVLTTHFDTKILPRIGPTAYGGEVTEGKSSLICCKVVPKTGCLNIQFGIRLLQSALIRWFPYDNANCHVVTWYGPLTQSVTHVRVAVKITCLRHGHNEERSVNPGYGGVAYHRRRIPSL